MPLESGEIFGLRLTVVGGGEAVSIGAGRCRDAENRADLEIPEGETRLVSPAVSGLGGLDTGTIAPRTSYALYLVKVGADVQGLLSRSFDPAGPTPPVFPPNARYRRIGAGATDAQGRIVPFQQTGNREDRRYEYLADLSVLAVLVDGAATADTPFDLAPFFHVRADLAQIYVVPGNAVAVTVSPSGPGGGPTLSLAAPTSYGFKASDLENVTVGQYRNATPGGSTKIAVLGFTETL